MINRSNVYFSVPILWLIIPFIMISCGRAMPKEDIPKIELEESEDNNDQVQTKEFFSGLDITGLSKTSTVVRPNESLSILLEEYRYDINSLIELANMSKNVFDVRKITSGKPITIIHTNDSIPEVQYVVYEPIKSVNIIYSFTDSLAVTKFRKPIEMRYKTMSGIIEYSLYQSIIDAGGSAVLVDELVDILAWQIDFFGVQKGDRFKVIYTEKLVDDEVVGIHQIEAAYFESYNTPYYAYKYCQGSGEIDYFDDEGNSVRKAFLRAPLQYSRISSRYNPRRFHPVQKRYKAHLGTDYAAPRGTPIRTVGDGVVVKSTYTKNNGNYVKIKHNSTYSTQYLHMSKIASGIRRGVKVKKGQLIGFVGSTGLATGPHLCYRFWKNGVQVDALRVKLPPSKPISEDYREDFEIYKEIMKKEIDSIQYDSLTKIL